MDGQELAQSGGRPTALGHSVSHNVAAGLLREMGYSLESNRKTLEGASHPDRDAQFRYINDQVKSGLASQQPAISVGSNMMKSRGRLVG